MTVSCSDAEAEATAPSAVAPVASSPPCDEPFKSGSYEQFKERRGGGGGGGGGMEGDGETKREGKSGAGLSRVK